MFSCPFRHDTTLQQHRLPSYGKRYEVEGRTNFLELRYGEVRRNLPPPTSVNKGQEKTPGGSTPGAQRQNPKWPGYLTPTTSLTFSVKDFFVASCSLLRGSWSSCRWRASSSISLLSVILRASFSSSRSFLV